MQDLGLLGEEMAAEYLERVKGWRVLQRRARFREGEIDLVAETSEGELRFVEVKARKSTKFGGVVEALTTSKLRRLKKAIYRWREASGDKRIGQLYFLGIFWNSKGEFTMEEHCIE